MSRQAAVAAVRTAAPAVLAVAAFLLLGFSAAGWLGYAAVCLALAASWAGHRQPACPGPPLGTDRAARTLLAAAVLVPVSGPTAAVVLAAPVLVGLPLAEPILRRLARPWFHTAHLSAARPRTPAVLVTDGTAWLAHAAAVALAGVVAVLGWSGWLLLVPAGGVALLAGALAVDGARRWRTGHRAELAPLTRALTAHSPRFLLYFSAPPGSEYQARMWLPHLARIGEPFVVVLPERHNLPAVAAATTAPVVVYDTFEALDAVMAVPGLRAAFYVNNGRDNAHCVRYARLTHVQLYHGDSDKAVTASPLNAMYDRIFVAGQAAVDRFAAHGVSIPPEKFRIVGRPQVAGLKVAEPEPVTTVLYAPTWVGAHADSNHCSLPIAERIIEQLRDRGLTVIFRPHPYSRRDPASAATLHRLAARGLAEPTGASLYECMNRAHAMICDVSSVASDFLYTGKPFAITDMRDEGDRFTASFPVARAAYVIRRDAGNLGAVLDDLRDPDRDPLAATRREVRGHYLGDFPPDRYAEAFLTAARDCLTLESAA
jgi:hypothetical protein